MEVQKTAGEADWTDMNGPWRYAMQRVYSHWGPSFYRWIFTDADSVFHYGDWEQVMMTAPGVEMNPLTRSNLPSGGEDYCFYVRVGNIVIVNFSGDVGVLADWRNVLASGLPESDVGGARGSIVSVKGGSEGEAPALAVHIYESETTLTTDGGTAVAGFYMGQIVYFAKD
jgi:hypothetical protein